MKQGTTPSLADTSIGAASSVEIYMYVRGCVVALSLIVLGCLFMLLVGLCVGGGGAVASLLQVCL